ALLNSRAELDAASRHLQLIMNHASELICSFDESDRFLTANEASHGLLGVTPDKLKGTSFLDIVHPEEREVTLQTLRSARVGTANVTLTIRCKRSDNTRAGIAWSFQWSSHYHTLFGVGRGSTGLESCALGTRQDREIDLSDSANPTPWCFVLGSRSLSEPILDHCMLLSKRFSRMNGSAAVGCQTAISVEGDAVGSIGGALVGRAM
ncbi:MAG: PAS domain-containing protein, partial [Verrucomicrobiota bacterium]|nr:PAS domain-containing protein [Verrucomicrobiota bacterium]